jgi:hypothetical protein
MTTIVMMIIIITIIIITVIITIIIISMTTPIMIIKLRGVPLFPYKIFARGSPLSVI